MRKRRRGWYLARQTFDNKLEIYGDSPYKTRDEAICDAPTINMHADWSVYFIDAEQMRFYETLGCIIDYRLKVSEVIP